MRRRAGRWATSRSGGRRTRVPLRTRGRATARRRSQAGRATARPVSRRTPRTAAEIAPWSGFARPGSARKSAISSARRWGDGRRLASSSSTSSKRSRNDAKASGASDRAGAQLRTREGPASARVTAYRQSVVLPIPGISVQNERSGRLGVGVEELVEDRELVLAADDCERGCRNHVPDDATTGGEGKASGR